MSIFAHIGNPRSNKAKKNVASSLASKALVLVDDTVLGVDTMNYAIHVAQKTGCELFAAFVIDTASMDLLLQMKIFVREERDTLEEEMLAKGRRTLETVRMACANKGVPVQTLLLKGCLHQVIDQTIRANHIDFLIIGGWHNTSTRKDTASTERQLVLDTVDCPVLVVKSPKR